MCVCVSEEIYSSTYSSSYVYYLQSPLQLLQDRTNKSLFRLSLNFSKSSPAHGLFRELVLTFPQLQSSRMITRPITVWQIVTYVILIFILGKLWVSSRKKRMNYPHSDLYVTRIESNQKARTDCKKSIHFRRLLKKGFCVKIESCYTKYF